MQAVVSGASQLQNVVVEEITMFEIAHKELGEMLGSEAGRHDTDASPDPWWISGRYCLVFEDHSDAQPSSSLGADKARQDGE
jgi:hypothetical protein